MNAYIISIGEELLIGQTVNTNASWLAAQLNKVGVSVREILVIPDQEQEIIQAIRQASEKADIVMITGGLGPTRDDVTKNALCKIFDSPLILNETVLNDIIGFFQRKGLAINELNRQQALVPEKAGFMRNPNGTAPGLWFTRHGRHYIAMPGVPYEMKEMVIKEVLPKLAGENPDQHILHKTILTQGMGESFLAGKIARWEEDLPGFINLAYLPSPGIVKLRLSARGADPDLLKHAVEKAITQLKELIPQYIWGYDGDTLEGLAGELLLGQKMTLSTAESCTGGYVAHRITSVPGSSSYFRGSVIAYDNKVKEDLLEVDEQLISEHGAVSGEVATAMATGVKKRLNTDYAIGVTGIAGPSGGSEGKPVGTTWIAVTGQTKTRCQKHTFGDNRERNVLRATNAALALLLQVIKEEHPADES